MSQLLEKYAPPEWTKPLKDFPTVKVSLANLNTPIQPWDLPGIPEGVSMSIKRDDMTGSDVTGTKIRKLEFLMADAIKHNCKHVITCGGIQSNHCRAVAVSARRLGLTPHLVMYSDHKNTESLSCDGNMLIQRLCGSLIYPTSGNYQDFTELEARMEDIAVNLRESCDKKSYQIPRGGSNRLGMFGDIMLFAELIKQGMLDRFDDLVCASSTGGTAAGLAVANLLTGSKIRVHGFSVANEAKILHRRINNWLNKCGLEAKSEDILNINDKHIGACYGATTQDDIEFITNVGSTTGILLDPVYTGKAVRGLLYELNNNPSVFRGNRILYLHTGGMFGLFEEAFSTSLTQASKMSTDQSKPWTNGNVSIPETKPFGKVHLTERNIYVQDK